MALNSQMHEAYLDMPLEAQMLPELAGLPFWGRTAHQLMLTLNPVLLNKLAQEGSLRKHLDKQQENLSAEARKLEQAWKRNHPLPSNANYLETASWNQHAKLSAREQLIEEMTISLTMMATEPS